MSKEQTQIIFNSLQDLTREQFIAGVRRFCKLHKNIYNGTNLLAHIREYALADRVDFPDALVAWSEVMAQIHKVGFYGTPIFSASVIKNVVEAIGWSEICRCENIDVMRGQFIKLYSTHIEREKIRKS